MLYWISHKKCFVYLLPLLFSTFAKLGQLYSSTVFLSVLLLWGVQS